MYACAVSEDLYASYPVSVEKVPTTRAPPLLPSATSCTTSVFCDKVEFVRLFAASRDVNDPARSKPIVIGPTR